MKPIGRYGRLNDMVGLKEDALQIAMTEYAAELALAEDIFVAY